MGLFSRLFGKEEKRTDRATARKAGDPIHLIVSDKATPEEVEIGKRMAALLHGAERVKKFTSQKKPICPYCGSVVDVRDERVRAKQDFFSEPLQCDSCGKIMDWCTGRD